MDFRFDLAQVFPGTTGNILKIGCDMLPTELPRSAIPYRSLALVQQRVSHIIDTMGELSAHAQGLKAPITSGAKVRAHPEHSIYLLIDRESNAGMGSVVGLLKVGKKNLFLLDRNGQQNEVCPNCILDFYVHESRQRSGCGRRLFEVMLKDQEIHPRNMAIDRPSPKLLGFLKKYYDLCGMIPQVNNYVIFDGFFNDNNNTNINECGVKRPRIYMGKLQYIYD